MNIDQQLIEVRSDYENGSSSEEEFVLKVNTILVNISTSTTAKEKIAIFDRLAKFISENLSIENADQYLDDDTPHYIFEEVLLAFCGKDFFKFFNKTYTEL